MRHSLQIDAWELDDRNLEEMAEHGMTRRIFFQVTKEAPRFRRNRRGHSATHQMVGPDNGGTIWVVPIEERKDDPGVWRPATGWQAEPEDVQWYRRSR
jgi:hypothetical protein